MNAARISAYGTPANIAIIDIPEPEVLPGHVAIKVQACALNPWDSKILSGVVQSFLPLELPVTLGGDVAGIILAVGQGVDGLAVGDAVYGGAGAPNGSGALAEIAVTSADSVARSPKNFTAVDAAASVLTGVSTWQAIVQHLNVHSGEKILIHGAAGGIGSLAVQLAKHLGAYVAATAKGTDIALVRSLGADEVIDYENQDFTQSIHGYDAVFDTVGGETNTKSYAVLKSGGTLLSMTDQPNAELMQTYHVTATMQYSKVDSEALVAVSELFESGVLTVRVDKTFPLSDAAAAFMYRESGQANGKVVVTIN